MSKLSTAYCLSCAREFHPASPDAFLCPDCGGPPEATTPQPAVSPQTLLEPAPVSHSPARTLLQPSGAHSFTESDVPADWQAGDTLLDTYTVSGLLGEGGMGKVYRVHHKSWNIDLAVKSPRAEFFQTQEQKDLFISEAETWVNLGLHPHIVSCYYVRTLGGIPRVFAELVEGGSLSEWIQQCRITTLEQALDIAIQFAWGLAYAHEQGLVHRDVKPANVLMTPEGTVKVTDFGLAKAGKGMTPAYASPEQAEAQLKEIELTPQADMWSWGLSILEMFAGRAFWVRPDMPDYAWGQVAPQALEHYQSEEFDGSLIDMPTILSEVLQQCFQINPSERPAKMDILAERLVAAYAALTGSAYPRKKSIAADLRADSLNNQAVSMLDLHRIEEAKRIWQQAQEIDAFHPQSRYNRLLLEWRLCEIDDLTVVNELNKISGDTAKYLLGLVHLERDDCQAAIEILESLPVSVQKLEDVQSALHFARQRLPQSSQLTDEIEAHRFMVYAVSVSGNDRTLLSGGGLDYNVKLWDARDKRLLKSLDNGGSVRSVDLSVDGKLALSAGENGVMKLWDVENSRVLQTFKGHQGGITCVRLSPDQGRAFSASGDKTVKVWETSSGNLLLSVACHTREVTTVCLSPNAESAFSAGFDQTIEMWDTVTGRLIKEFSGHTSFIDSVSCSADGQVLISGGGDRQLMVWDVASGQCLRTLIGHTSGIQSTAISHSGKYALSGDRSGMIKLWDLASGRCLRTLIGGKGQQFSLCWGENDCKAYSSVYDHKLQLWRIGAPESFYSAPYTLSKAVTAESALNQKEVFTETWSQVQQAVQGRDYRRAAGLLRRVRAMPGFENDARAIKAWCDLYTHLPRKSFRYGWIANAFSGSKGYPKAAELSADGSYALVGSDSFEMQLWDPNSGQLVHTFSGTRGVHSLCLSPDETLAVSGGVGQLQVWDIAARRCLWQQSTAMTVNAMAMTSDGRFILSCARDIDFWETASGRKVRTISIPLGNTVLAVAVGPNNRSFLTGQRTSLQLWDLASGQVIKQFQGHTNSIESVCISPDGRLGLSGSVDQTVRLWDLSTGDCLLIFAGHERVIDTVRFSPDGRFALSSCRDHTLKVWDISTGQCAYTLLGHAQPVTKFDISADGQYLFSMGWGSEMKLWQLDWDLEERNPVDWDEGARKYLENFLDMRRPYSSNGFTRQGNPVWIEAEFSKLLSELAYHGYGWLRPEGVRRKLEAMAAGRA